MAPNRATDQSAGDDHAHVRAHRRALQRRQQRGNLSAAAKAVLSRVDPHWDADVRDLRWLERKTACAQFVNDHGRLPSESIGGEPTSAEERALARWLSRQRRLDLPEWKIRELSAIPDWEQPRTGDNYWEARAEEIGKWISTSGRKPRTHGNRVPAAEISMGRWLITARTVALADPAKAATLDRHISDWRTKQQSEESWEVRLTETATWCREQGRLAKYGTDNVTEERHAQWLGYNRKGTLSRKRRAALDKHIPGWDTPGRGDDVWERNITELTTWMWKHRTMPRAQGGTKHESSLRAVYYRVEKWKDQHPSRHKLLHDQLAGWEPVDTTLARDTERAATIRAFVKNTGRLPKRSSDDPIERKYHGWMERSPRVSALVREVAA